MKLPIFQASDSPEFMLMQTQWATALNPILINPIGKGILLKNVELSTGDNVINHRLGRELQGWVIVRKRADKSIYDKQDSNSMPELTLKLTSSGNVIVDLYVF